MRIREGDPLEIYSDKEGIVLKKHYPLAHLGSTPKGACETLNRFTGREVIVCDENLIVAAAGKTAEKYIGKEISKSLLRLINEKEKWLNNSISLLF